MSTDLEPSAISWQEWQVQLAELGSANPLKNFEPNSWSQIDLNKAHPGGFAQFVSTDSVRLSNLIRDPLALTRSTAVAQRIMTKNLQLELAYGVHSSYLVSGLVSLRSGGFDLSLPILLWPISLKATSDDYQITLIAKPSVNPELVLAFDSCFDVKIDQAKLIAKATDGADLLPMSVLEYLSDLGSGTTSLELKRVLAIANFVPELTALKSASLKRDTSSVVNQLLGETPAEASEGSDFEPRVFFDLDSNQRKIVHRAINANSFAVEVLPGCGYTQTVAAVVANLALQRKRVLLVANRSQTFDEVSQRLADNGFAGLIARSQHAWLDVVAGISRNEKAAIPQAISANLAEVSDRLQRYNQALTSNSNQYAVSILECFRKLAELAAMPHAPTAKARIKQEHLVKRDEYEELLVLFKELDQQNFFQNGPKKSAWYAARFDSQQQIDQAVATANRLRAETFPQLASKLAEFISTAQFAPADSVAQWGTYLRLFVGLRETLDRLNPQVFDRPLDDLITATAARKDKGSMSGKTRRRLKKLAKEFIRPGMVVSDINESLQAAKSQRELWARYSTSLKPPMVPAGINDALVSYQALVKDLELLQGYLANNLKLDELSLASLGEHLDSLCEKQDPLHDYFVKKERLKQLQAAGLDDVVDEFALGEIKPEHMILEFDQIWWQSALEILLAESSDFTELDRDEVLALEAKYRSQDMLQVETQRMQASYELSQNWQADLKTHQHQVELFRSLLKSGKATLRELIGNAPDLLFSVSPVIATTALSVPEDLADARFDCLILLDAAGTTIGENLVALMKSKQVIAFGDEVISQAIGFETEPAQEPIQLQQVSAFREIADRFGSESLKISYRTDGQILGAFVNREFYQSRIQFEPSLSDYLQKSRVKLNLVQSTNATSSSDRANESIDSEVIKVAELIFNHAAWHPEDSLLVATASRLHAERIRTSISSGLANRPDLQAWFDSHGSERFEVATLSELRHRVADRVIFSIGFGKSQHGAVLTNFGELNGTSARRALANLLVSVRKELHVVSCFTAEELAKAQLSEGAAYVKDLLTACHTVELENFDLDPDPLVTDLGLRLRKLGVTVRFGCGQQLAMVASFGQNAMVLVPDWQLHGTNDAEKYRIRPTLLEHLGWHYERLTSFELFAEPLLLAQRIAKQLGLSVKNAGQQSFEPDWVDESNLANTVEQIDSNDHRLKNERPPHWG